VCYDEDLQCLLVAVWTGWRYGQDFGHNLKVISWSEYYDTLDDGIDSSTFSISKESTDKRVKQNHATILAHQS
jgi:hypothetical protein